MIWNPLSELYLNTMHNELPVCKIVEKLLHWLGGLAARAFDLRLDGREFNSQAALLSSDSGQVTHTYLA